MTSRPVRDWTFWALLAAAFTAGWSLPAARFCCVVAAVGLAVDALRGRRRWVATPSAWAWIAFVAWASFVTAQGLNPAKGLARLPKLAWYLPLLLVPSIVRDAGELRALVRALAGGLALRAAAVVVGNLAAARAVVATTSRLRHPTTFWQALIDAGTLTDGQRLMVGLVLAAGFWLAAPGAWRQADERVEAGWRAGQGAWRSLRLPASSVPLALAGLFAVAEVINLKRGAWFCTAAVLVPLLGPRIGWRRLLLAGAAVAALACAVPPVRTRLAGLSDEFRADSGGRVAMWTRVAPGLLREHPWGIGFRSLTPELMRRYDPKVEPNRDHLHSNLVETAVSVGWLGLGLYLVWMGLLLRDAWSVPGHPRVLFWAITALLLNGLVEYSFADGEIVLLLGLLGGLAAAGRRTPAA